MPCNSPIYREILDVLNKAKSPIASVSTITRRVTVTRHDSRVHGALIDLEGAGEVVLTESGWKAVEKAPAGQQELEIA